MGTIGSIHWFRNSLIVTLKKKSEAHAVACKYYLSIPLSENPKKKDELHPAIEAHYHACEAEIYDLAARIILHLNLHIFLDTWGDYTVLITLYRRLLPVDPFKEEVLLSNEMKSFVFGDLGLTYQQLGFVKKAIEYHEQALKISREIGDRRGEGNRLGNLGSAYYSLGEPRKAIELLKQSLAIGKAIEDPRIISFCEQILKELKGSDK
jgi:tetratricopeptide (TPR) repeat protein